ncbi:MAG: phage Gp37/Gp68 family protein [Firmicutes bacterium]|nr:phage Gp37/Gp68 family protein [Bacillota bacterium]
MSFYTNIEWTETTWNPVTGCTKISNGCKNCYAERLAIRLKLMNNPRYKNGFKVTLHPDQVNLPLRWKKSRMIFVNSMSDLFHNEVPVDFIKSIFETMRKAQHHVFQVLTKRSNRLLDLAPQLVWTDNIWMGVTVEDTKAIKRIYDLQKTKAKIKFISAEPLLEDISRDLPLQGINWLIAGGESGPFARPIKAEWVRNLRDHCLSSDVPFFFKQWGGHNKKSSGRILDGQTWSQMPSMQANHQTNFSLLQL